MWRLNSRRCFFTFPLTFWHWIDCGNFHWWDFFATMRKKERNEVLVGWSWVKWRKNEAKTNGLGWLWMKRTKSQLLLLFDYNWESGCECELRWVQNWAERLLYPHSVSLKLGSHKWVTKHSGTQQCFMALQSQMEDEKVSLELTSSTFHKYPETVTSP